MGRGSKESGPIIIADDLGIKFHANRRRRMKVRELPEWKKYTEDAAFNTTFMTGKQFADWVQSAENVHKGLMQEAGFLATK